ncbi:tRNA (5-methylaminomethyl-2-thiouridine)(34)-methyltransferase MnmD [Halomicronema sp. CCY15110]|uniref:tRNA (5-methylaminomethyl-2-thiouridine)(34)-methyltransferase MnmD n=1 Tax=Halomicronema sp. CCY15110 TaxID=2767773 RepID=UPI0035CD0ACB
MAPDLFTVEPTADGSATFYSETFGEWFHSRNGAYDEARSTYVQATQLVERAQTQGHITLLDVCYGLGYNTAAALERLWAVRPELPIRLVGLELDVMVPRAAIAQGLLNDWPESVQVALAEIASPYPKCPSQTWKGHFSEETHLTAKLLIGDARQQIQNLVAQNFQADVIFLDPFSPPRCPQLWTVEFLSLVAQCLHPQGILATYSCAAAVRTALTTAGLHIGSLAAPGRRWPSTLASHAEENLPPLSQQELEHLLTRAAVPYRDPTLRDEAAMIQQRRSQEQAQSSLRSTGAWRRRWLSASARGRSEADSTAGDRGSQT